MSAHGSRSAKAYNHSSGKPQVISDRKWDLSKLPKTIQHSSNYECLPAKQSSIKCYSQNSMYFIRMHAPQILFELNTSKKFYKVYIENHTIQKSSFKQLLLQIQSRFNEHYFKIIGALKENICLIDKSQNDIINTIKSMPEIHTGLLGAVSTECTNKIAMGYIRRHFKGDLAKELDSLIFKFYCVHNDTQFYSQSREKIKETNDRYIIKHNARNAQQHMVVSHFKMTTTGDYIFRIRAMQIVPYNEVCVMQRPSAWIDVLKKSNFSPSDDQINGFWKDPKNPTVHGVVYMKNKDLLELKLVDKGCSMFQMEVWRNGRLDQTRVLRMDRKYGTFYPCLFFGHHSRVIHSIASHSLAEFHVLK